jgi:hypothetical protein
VIQILLNRYMRLPTSYRLLLNLYLLYAKGKYTFPYKADLNNFRGNVYNSIENEPVTLYVRQY